MFYFRSKKVINARIHDTCEAEKKIGRPHLTYKFIRKGEEA
jgi:hypothetical protein